MNMKEHFQPANGGDLPNGIRLSWPAITVSLTVIGLVAMAISVFGALQKAPILQAITTNGEKIDAAVEQAKDYREASETSYSEAIEALHRHEDISAHPGQLEHNAKVMEDLGLIKGRLGIPDN